MLLRCRDAHPAPRRRRLACPHRGAPPCRHCSRLGRPARCGAVVLFSGTARDHAPGREGVELLDYEAYEEHVVPRLADIAAEMRSRWPDLGRVVLIHRIGPVDIGESSVIVVASAPTGRLPSRRPGSVSTPSSRPCRSGSVSAGPQASRGASNPSTSPTLHRRESRERRRRLPCLAVPRRNARFRAVVAVVSSPSSCRVGLPGAASGPRSGRAIATPPSAERYRASRRHSS